MNISDFKSEVVENTRTITIGPCHIRHMLEAEGFTIPNDAEFECVVQVPGGGDWDINLNDSPLKVRIKVRTDRG